MLARYVALCAAALTAGPLAAQPSAPVQPLDPLVPPPAPTATAVLTDVADESPPRPKWSTDLLVGLPLAVRGQRHLVGPVWAEVGLGVWIIIPDAFAGLRLDVGLYRGRTDTIAVRPGVVAHALFNPFYGGGGFLSGGPPVLPGVSGDVDLVWQRCWGDGLHGQFGMKLGAVTVFGENIGVVPTVAVLFGCQF